MKKIVTMLLCLLLACGTGFALTACDLDNSSNDSVASEQSATSESSSEEAGESASDSTEEIPEPVYLTLEAGAIEVDLPANGTAILSGYGLIGDYTVTWDSSVTNLMVYAGRMPVENGGKFNNASPMMEAQLVVSTTDGAAVKTTITVTAYVAPAVELVLGDNNISIDAMDGLSEVTFTAAEDGKYTFTCENADLVYLMENGFPGNALTGEIELKAGETLKFGVGSQDWETLDVVVTVAKVASTTTA